MCSYSSTTPGGHYYTCCRKMAYNRLLLVYWVGYRLLYLTSNQRTGHVPQFWRPPWLSGQSLWWPFGHITKYVVHLISYHHTIDSASSCMQKLAWTDLCVSRYIYTCSYRVQNFEAPLFFSFNLFPSFSIVSHLLGCG